MNYKIDKGIPMPAQRSTSQYPWHILQVGESFFIPDKLSTNFHYVNKRLAPKRFIFRIVVEDGVKGVRVWRAPDDQPQTPINNTPKKGKK